MNRLFVTDMDGCLLDDNKQMPSDFDEILKLINDNGDYFAVASGRSYPSLNRMFENYLDRIYIIADNGGNIKHDKKTLYFEKMEKEDIKRIVLEVKKHEGAIPMMTAANYCYIENYDKIDKDQRKEFLRYYQDYKNVDNLLEVKDDIDKITILYIGDIEKDVFPFIEKLVDEKITASVSGPVWIDIVNKTINKGVGISKIQEALNVSPANTYVFGDYLNDKEMCEFADNSYAPSNAHPLIKQLFKETIGSNNDGCVTKQIKKIIND